MHVYFNILKEDEDFIRYNSIFTHYLYFKLYFNGMKKK